MKVSFLFVILIAGFFLFSLVPCNADESRIAVISMERIFDQHHKTRSANLRLRTRVAEMEEERKSLLADVKQLKSEAESLGREASDGSLSDLEQKRKREEARAKNALAAEAEDRLIRFDQFSKSELGEHMRETQDEIVNDIRRTVEEYVREKNIVLVLDNSGKTMNAVEAVIYFDRVLDITDQIIAVLNEKQKME